MIKHIVMWTIKESAGKKEEIQKEIKLRLEAMPEKISEIKELEVGIDFKQSAAAYDVVLYSVFESKETLEAYQVHPDHENVKEYIGSVVDKRAVVDYEI